MKFDATTFVWIALGAGAIAGLSYLESQGIIPAAPVATPLSVYPEYAYTAQTSMAASPAQKTTAAVIIPTPYYTSVQQAAQSAIYAQCMGAPNCSPLLGDTQLGF
jgi:hypothetical protein